MSCPIRSLSWRSGNCSRGNLLPGVFILAAVGCGSPKWLSLRGHVSASTGSSVGPRQPRGRHGERRVGEAGRQGCASTFGPWRQHHGILPAGASAQPCPGLHGAAEGLRHGLALSSPSSEEWPFRLGISSETKAGFSASPQKNISRLDDVEHSWRFRGLRGSSCVRDCTSRLHGGQSRTSGGLFCLVPPYSCERDRVSH